MTKEIYEMDQKDLENGKAIIRFFHTLGLDEKEIDNLVAFCKSGLVNKDRASSLLWLIDNAKAVLDTIVSLATSIDGLEKNYTSDSNDKKAEKAKKLTSSYDLRKGVSLNV